MSSQQLSRLIVRPTCGGGEDGVVLQLTFFTSRFERTILDPLHRWSMSGQPASSCYLRHQQVADSQSGAETLQVFTDQAPPKAGKSFVAMGNKDPSNYE